MAINRIMRDGTLILENTENGECVEIHEKVNTGYVCIAPKGKLTGAIAHDLEDELTSLALVCRNLVLDMSGVSAVSNSVIRMMLDVQHMVDGMKGEFTLRAVRRNILSQFEEMGLDAVFEFEQEYAIPEETIHQR